MFRKILYLVSVSITSTLLAQPDYFPLTHGNRWNYQSKFLISTTNFSQTIMGTRAVQGEQWHEFDVYRLNNNVLFRKEGEHIFTLVDTSKYLLYRFSENSAKSWLAPDSPDANLGRITIRSTNDSVTTNMGTFYHCYHFQHYFDEANLFDEWFAPDIGLVRRDTRLFNGIFCATLTGYNLETQVFELQTENPWDFQLFQNFPNPFNNTTTIAFSLSRSDIVRIDIFNLKGQMVGRLMDACLSSGHHAIKWDATDVSTGTYIYQFRIGEQMTQRKCVLIK